jgi:8-oxo-dGTP pyrophosphatase MutT (NUDIX family)
MRIRGTALVFREKKILIVRDRGKQKFSFPGGGKNAHEPPLATAIRELYEELGMSARKAERIFECDTQGTVNNHKVSLIETEDKPYLRDRELDEFIWWDMTNDIPRYHHIDQILHKYSRSMRAF